MRQTWDLWALLEEETVDNLRDICPAKQSQDMKQIAEPPVGGMFSPTDLSSNLYRTMGSFILFQ